jgi:hypothetical protein
MLLPAFRADAKESAGLAIKVMVFAPVSELPPVSIAALSAGQRNVYDLPCFVAY